MTTHTYRTHLACQGSTGLGYHGYPRRHRAVAPPSPEIELSADPHFGGEADRLNPEQLLVMAASSCQLLSFLAVAAQDGVDVLDYTDEAEGTMSTSDNPMRIERIELSPVILVSPGTDPDRCTALAHRAHQGCYVANSLTTSITLVPTVVTS